MKSIRLTKQAEEQLASIAEWTFQTFGPRQADAYEKDLIQCCERIAGGMAHRQSCTALVDGIDKDVSLQKLGVLRGRASQALIVLEAEQTDFRGVEERWGKISTDDGRRRQRRGFNDQNGVLFTRYCASCVHWRIHLVDREHAEPPTRFP